jgi:hypothetical protein
VSKPEGRPIGDDEVITQYGNLMKPNEPPFRSRPRFEKPENDVSAMLGPATVTECAQRVTRRPALPGKDGVRHAKVGDLRAAGFTVVHSPSRGNRDHVSIELDGAWDDDEDQLFNQCWSEPEWEVGA